ncbi:GPW/gp25 family protein [Halomonas rhizosphaerae]|uniref:GPW/gp25 family protein n=1 Tax=Halomonas rhizosphaerae TaxID=3043296 RepID=A0ABT6V4E3_9GAMM|nr:GPW/gp25 family protein [Halomonas rhizosphaerae]MDI5893079.1 GPW/gp25 family protein [Halomonas rhizosphaerae]
MTGMNATTGRALEGVEHIRQSVSDILATPIGSRVMRRDYGSLLPELIDRPLNDATLLQVYAATAMALIRWEPRLRVTAIRRAVSSIRPGHAVIEVEGQTTAGQPIRLEVPVT